MAMTPLALQHSCVSRPRLLLQPLSRPARPCAPLQRAYGAKAAPRFRPRASGEGQEPRPAPEAQEPQAAPLPEQQPRRERWQPASLLSGWKGPASLLMSVAAVSGGGLLGTNFSLEGPSSVLEALGVLALTVAVHEAGHFIAARAQNIHVTKFSIGFGPILAKYQGKEVEYSLRALPLGGFVAFPDDDPESKFPPDDPDLLRNRPVADRILVVSAGVIANMIFAYLTCVTQANTVGIAQADYKPGVIIGTVNPGAVAEFAGLQRGDILLEVGDLKVAPSPSSVGQVVSKISVNPKKELNLTVDRNGEVLTIPITPAEQPDGSGRIGVSLGPNSTVTRRMADNVLEALQLGGKEVAELASGVAKGLSQFVTNFQQTAEQVSGPVAIVAVGAEVARRDASGLYQFCALVNINLAIVNILPLPALDGGYLVFLLIEAVRGGKKVPAEVERGIMASGLLLLTTLGMFLVVRDTLTLSGIL